MERRRVCSGSVSTKKCIYAENVSLSPPMFPRPALGVLPPSLLNPDGIPPSALFRSGLLPAALPRAGTPRFWLCDWLWLPPGELPKNKGLLFGGTCDCELLFWVPLRLGVPLREVAELISLCNGEFVCSAASGRGALLAGGADERELRFVRRGVLFALDREVRLDVGDDMAWCGCIWWW